MNSKQRLLATLRGEPVDRPAVCFYEINGLTQDEGDPDHFNIYSHPSWAPLLELTRMRSDRIVQLGVPLVGAPPAEEWGGTHRTWLENGSRISEQVLQAGNRNLRRRTRRDPDTDTVWTTEHLLKDANDLDAFRLLSRFARRLRWQLQAVARALLGRLWRIYGPEYATPPYLHPRQFRRLVCAHDAELVGIIHASGGWARIHSHGRIRQLLPDIAALGADALDPLEPLPQGDVTLAEVGAGDGRGMVLFGNLEASDLEHLAPVAFAGKVATALAEARLAPRGFVLMSSACPYGRVLGPTALAIYRTMVEMAEAA
jgi:hypothetical protein